MPKIGERRTRTSYVEATDIASMIGITGSMITTTIGGSLLSTLVTKLSKKIAIAGALSSPFVLEVYNQLKNKTLSRYKVKFTTTEVYAYERVFDTHEWIDAYLWKHAKTTYKIVKKY